MVYYDVCKLVCAEESVQVGSRKLHNHCVCDEKGRRAPYPTPHPEFKKILDTFS